MNKKINLSKVFKIFIYLKYLPTIITKIKNWQIFVLNYIGIKNNKNFIYAFRDGTKLKVDDNINAATIAVVFIKKDYGDVKENSTVIDIGANIGTYSVYAGKNKNVKVYAFEPMSENFKLLEENIRLNKLEGIIFPFNYGVGAKKEIRTLYLGGSPFHSFYPADDLQGRTSVQVVSLKDVFCDNEIEYCNMLKIDCEGAEFEILYNLPEEYFKKIEKIRIEYHDHKTDTNCTGEKLAEFLKSNGFKIEKHKKSTSCGGDMWFYNPKFI